MGFLRQCAFCHTGYTDKEFRQLPFMGTATKDHSVLEFRYCRGWLGEEQCQGAISFEVLDTREGAL